MIYSSLLINIFNRYQLYHIDQYTQLHSCAPRCQGAANGPHSFEAFREVTKPQWKQLARVEAHRVLMVPMGSHGFPQNPGRPSCCNISIYTYNQYI